MKQPKLKTMKRLWTTIVAVGLGVLAAMGQGDKTRVTAYDAEDGVPSGHITQLLQDKCGFLWFATWNGLCRYDGYDFQTFKPVAGDGCHIPTDRIRDIGLRPDGNILCRMDDDYFLFDTRSYRFRDLTSSEQPQAADDILSYRQSRSLITNPLSPAPYPLLPTSKLSFALTDSQGNQWVLGANDVIYKITTAQQRTERLDIHPAAEVKCLFRDSQKHWWLATKDDGAVRVYSGDGNWLLGYLGPDGVLHEQYVSFGSPVYCMYESPDGTLWLGTKPDGLFRLHQTASNAFRIDHLNMQIDNRLSISRKLVGSVYNVTQDRYGRLWVATLGGGLCYTTEPQADVPHFIAPAHYPADKAQRVRYLKITSDGYLLAATTEGLMAARLEQDADKMTFCLHQREPDRAQSISSSAVMDVVEDARGQLWVGTESGGINRIESSNVTDTALVFRHFNEHSHALSTDVVLSLTATKDGGLLAVSDHLITLLDTLGQQRVLDARYFNDDYRLSDAHPLQLNDTTWLFGLTDGAFTTTTSQMYRTAYQPRLVLTSISIQGGSDNWAVEPLDTVTLQPRERSLTVRFAALDYSAPERISYAFRLTAGSNGDAPWNYIGHDRSATLLDLEPGTYLLEVRSTNADGQWTDNTRRLTIVVQPTFWESVWGRLLIVFLVVAAIAIVVYTLLYIRRIKREQHETLQKYLALIEGEKVEDDFGPSPAPAPLTPDEPLDPTLQRVMKFIEENISNSDASVGDMAEAAATSRSGLQRKLKQVMGITPQDLLREARIKRACQLLRQTDKTVAEIAYASGFTDPKYFSRCFKQSIGQSPTEYKADNR